MRMEPLKWIYDKANLKVCARELDIDRYTRSPFTTRTRVFLEKIYEIVPRLFQSARHHSNMPNTRIMTGIPLLKPRKTIVRFFENVRKLLTL